MSKPICDICGGVVENWKDRLRLKPRHRNADACLASALIRLSDTRKDNKHLRELLKQARLFINHNQLNESLINDIKNALKVAK